MKKADRRKAGPLQISLPFVPANQPMVRHPWTAGTAAFKMGSALCEFRLVPVDLLLVAVGFGEHAAAVFLHVKAQLPGPLVAGAEIGAEVPVEKFHAVLPGVPLRRLAMPS